MHEAHFSHTIICKGERRRRGLILPGLCNARQKRGSRGRQPPCGAWGVPAQTLPFGRGGGENYIALERRWILLTSDEHSSILRISRHHKGIFSQMPYFWNPGKKPAQAFARVAEIVKRLLFF